ncbi:hypothetical protein DFH11DRAFT_1542602 [Phellopilus nigrolimitatus]|nr:hypothetical protein DFH11DRAFT_1542602 [Phellopilus nigrolimitatus]
MSDSQGAKLAPLPAFPQIILALFFLPGPPLRFHWILYVPDPAGGDDGTKLHAIQCFGEFEFAAVPYNLAHCAETLAAAAVVGRLRVSDPDICTATYLDGGPPDGAGADGRAKALADFCTLLAQIPCDAVPPADAGRERAFTCRVWTREALRRMHAVGLVHCPDVDALEHEMRAHGKQTARAMADGTFSVVELKTAQHSH